LPDLIERARIEGGSIVLDCDPRLVPLFARSFPAATVGPQHLRTVGTATTAHYGWLAASGGATFAIEMGSLPAILRNDTEMFPEPNAYLVPDETETAHWRAALSHSGPGPLIGICWRSGKITGARALQYAPLEAWASFLRQVPGTIVSVQYDATEDEIAKLQSMSGRRIAMPPGIDQKSELDRTCALLSSLDAIVTAPTAVSWLAAGAGVATYKVLYHTSWTSFGSDREPFAPAAVCIRPNCRGDWEDAFETALAAIRAMPSTR
jgi:hypothetical protein